jgi:BirA family biotin operon repressor/biotin-[acetyl-CoA-carboxylase] ligase
MQDDLKKFANQTLDRCDSTNDIARKLGEMGYPSGTWVSTRIQEHGRGRLGRKWESLEGNLFLSVVLRVEKKSLWTWIPMGAAIAVASAVEKAFPQHKIPVQVKWPNDLWVHEKKLGGILCEAVGNKNDSFIVAGIGLNCAFAPDGLDQQTTSLSDIAQAKITADQIRDFVHEELMEVVKTLDREGTSFISKRYAELAALPVGTQIVWGETAQNSGTILKLGASGELIVQNQADQEQNLYAEDVKIRRKPAI